MGKYAEFANQMRKVYVAAHKEYMEIINQKEAAENEWRMVAHLPTFDRPENVKRQKKAKAELDYCNRTFQTDIADLRARTKEQYDKIRAELVEQIERDTVLDPEKVDMATMEILRAGIASAEDYSHLMKKFADNATMRRVIAANARQAANDERTERASRAQIIAVLGDFATEEGRGLRAFDNAVIASLKAIPQSGYTSQLVADVVTAQIDTLCNSL